MQLLCTLRDHCRQGPRNTRYQADATPYLGRTSTGWIAPALPGALIRSPRRRAAERNERHVEAQRSGGLEVDDQLEFRRCLNREVGGLFASEDAIDVRCRAPINVNVINSVGQQPAVDGENAERINRRQAMAGCERNDELEVC